ncbi:hypothetical protein BDY19DRAFT_919092 [Irpex rosettiformis]|uniref:Uncharacterized protein n=1 Tax=Irpex rosettiformis TaxID=378272 RepID=A0ACB8UHN4_9APHY|nr:hypothetical protein BDY19DRAFT_919092 [Irpex rosettiformis]
MHSWTALRIITAVAVISVPQAVVTAWNCAVCPSSIPVFGLSFSLNTSSEVTLTSGSNPRLQCGFLFSDIVSITVTCLPACTM